MDWAILDLVIVLAFVVHAVWSGFRARRQASESLSEYFLAGRSISGWRSGTSMAATQFAADTPLLVAGLVATGGVFMLWRLWIYGIAFILMGLVFANHWRRAGVLTDAEFTEARYSGSGTLPLRLVKAVYYGTIFNCIVMAWVLYAAVRIAEIFLPWHEWLPAGLFASVVSLASTLGLNFGASVTGLPPEIAATNGLISVCAILLFVALYSTTGGLRSVITTDVVQFAFAMIGTAALAGVILWQCGGPWEMTRQLSEQYGSETSTRMLSFWPSAQDAIMPLLVILSLQWLFQLNSDGTGYLAQRSMACRSDSDARLAGVLFAWLQVFCRSLLWLPICAGLLLIYPFTPETQAAAGDAFTAQREILFATGIDELLPVGLRGIMIAGMLAALASTIDTHLNWGASYWTNDIYQRGICQAALGREPSQSELVVVARLSNILVIGLALLVLPYLQSINDAWVIALTFGAGVGSVLVLRWLWERINIWSEIAAMIVSVVAAPLLLAYTTSDPASGYEWTWSSQATEALRLGSMAALSTLAAVGVALLTPPTDSTVLADFYRKVRPLGWWAHTARACDEDPAQPVRELAGELTTTALCAISLFALLIGCGKLLVPVPGESILWCLGGIAIGTALIPLWWPRIFRPKAAPQT